MHDHHIESDSQQRDPTTRVILLGASNARRGLPTLFETARSMFGPCIDMHVAIGHGRSYGAASRVMFRGLPGILECDLWNALNRAQRNQPAERTVAIITDIGNDILYGRSAQQLLDWVGEAIDRLMQLNARIAMTALPTNIIERVPRWQAKLVQLLTYPRSGLSIDTAIERARAVDTGVRELSEAQNIPLIEPDPTWYALDPIHITRAQWPRAAVTMYAPLVNEHNVQPLNNVPLRRRLHLRAAMPAHFRIAGIRFRQSQPVRMIESSTLSLY